MQAKNAGFLSGFGAGFGVDLLLRGALTAASPEMVSKLIREYEKLSKETLRALGILIAIVGGVMVAQAIVTSRALGQRSGPGAETLA